MSSHLPVRYLHLYLFISRLWKAESVWNLLVNPCTKKHILRWFEDSIGRFLCMRDRNSAKGQVRDVSSADITRLAHSAGSLWSHRSVSSTVPSPHSITVFQLCLSVPSVVH